jgi:hypothetical protein
MFFSGLKLCVNCGVFEIRGYRKMKNKKVFRWHDVNYWSEIPKYGLDKELCPKCDPKSDYDHLVEHWG